jgi:hypothetical protein
VMRVRSREGSAQLAASKLGTSGDTNENQPAQSNAVPASVELGGYDSESRASRKA